MGRDVALLEEKSAKLWIWRAYDVDIRRTVAWVLGRTPGWFDLGGRDDATCRKLLDKVGLTGKTFITYEWEGYHRVIPEDQLFTGKDLTVAPCAPRRLSRTAATSATALRASGVEPKSYPSAGPWLRNPLILVGADMVLIGSDCVDASVLIGLERGGDIRRFCGQAI